MADSGPTDSVGVSHSPMTCNSETKHSACPFIKERNAEQTIYSTQVGKPLPDGSVHVGAAELS